MKKLDKYFLLLILLLSNNLFSQESNPSRLMFGDLTGGVSVENSGNKLYNFNAGFTFVTSNNLVFRVGGDFGLGLKLTIPNSTVLRTGGNLKFGYLNNLSDKFKVIPYFGIGYFNSSNTINKYDDELNLINDLGSDLGIGQSKKRYLVQGVSYFYMPVGIDFHFHAKSVGFTFGPYMNISSYQDLGIKLGLTFGKMR